MKKRILIVASLCLVFGLASAPAYAQEGYVQGKIPFSFVVSGKTLPAGEYRIFSTPHQVKIEDGDGKPVALVSANDTETSSGAATDRIIFHCYRDRCFLAEVWSAPGKGREVLPSRAERELAKEEEAKYFAVLGEKPRR